MGSKNKKQNKTKDMQEFTNNSNVETSNEIFEQKTIEKTKAKNKKK